MKALFHIPCLSIVVSFFCLQPILSQGIYNNGAYIVIASGVYVYIDGDGSGDFRNETSGSNGSVDLDGELILEGDWTNNATGGNVFINIEAAPDGWTRFKGTTTQTIGGTRDTYFEKFEANNSAAGTSVSLSRNCIVKGSCTLTDGVVTTGANYLILESTTAADLSTFGSGSFINGNLRRYIASNTSTYSFPVGNNNASTNYKRGDFINNNLAGVTYLDASVTNITEGGSNIDGNLGANAQQGGVQLTDIVGSPATEAVEWTFLPNAAPSGGSYGVDLYVANTGLAGTDDDKFTVVKRSDGSTSYTDWSTYEATTALPAPGGAGRIYSGGAGYARRTGFTTFSKFAIGKGNNPLPVELLYFYGECTGGGVNLYWATASESNTDYFTIEKSSDGTHFSALGNENAAGSSTGILYYSMTDPRPVEGIAYYRLRETDYDGATTVFNTVAVDNCADTGVENYIKAFLVDNSYIFIIIKSDKNEKRQAQVFDAASKEILNTILDVSEGSNRYILELNGTAPGLYVLKVNNDIVVFTQKFILY